MLLLFHASTKMFLKGKGRAGKSGKEERGRARGERKEEERLEVGAYSRVGAY